MKRIITYFAIFVLLLNLTSIQVFAVRKLKPKEVIIVELTIENVTEAQKLEVPINKRKRKSVDAIGGSGSIVGGGDGIWSNGVRTSYSYSIEATEFNQNKVRVIFSASIMKNELSKLVEEKKVEKDFYVTRTESTEIKLNYGVSVKAYYSLQSSGKFE